MLPPESLVPTPGTVGVPVEFAALWRPREYQRNAFELLWVVVEPEDPEEPEELEELEEPDELDEPEESLLDESVGS